jgi:2-dehydropantoate 2-reductase
MSAELLIVGSGALATLFAARLSAAGVNLMMLGTWQEGLKALRNSGVYLDGVGAFKVWATDNPADCKGTKYALVLVKSWQTERAADQLVDCLGKDGLAVTFQNGLGNDQILSGNLGARRVSRGVTTLGAALLAPGIVRANGDGRICIEAHERLGGLEEVLRAADFDVSIVEDLQSMVWGKLTANAAINPLSALLRVKNGELLTNPPARELMGSLARETAQVAESLGVALPFSVPELAVEDVARNTAENVSSMLQDILRGSQTEVDVINGAVVRTGKKNRVPTPVNQVIWSLVKALPHTGKI